MKPNASLSRLFIANLKVKNIFLDIFNPRFACDLSAPKFDSNTNLNDIRAQERIRRYLLEKHGASELVESIMRVGFLNVDRIVVQKLVNDEYVVIEGNRRLAALKTILGDAQRKVLDLPKNTYKKLEEVEVVCQENDGDAETSALILQGIRHISGVKNWGPFQQGHLLHTLVEEREMMLSEAARMVGLSPSRVSVLLRGYYGLKQMQENTFFGKYADSSLFSHFEQAYIKAPIRSWLEWNNSKKIYENKKNISLFYEHISLKAPNGGPPIQSKQVRDLLPIILENTHARDAYLGGQIGIEEAYAITKPHKEYLEPLLKCARDFTKHIQGADSKLQITKRDRELLERIQSLTKNILKNSAVY